MKSILRNRVFVRRWLRNASPERLSSNDISHPTQNSLGTASPSTVTITNFCARSSYRLLPRQSNGPVAGARHLPWPSALLA